MKLKLQLIFLMFLSICASAQNEKGKFFVETGVKLSGGGDFLNFMGKTGISFSKTTTRFLDWEYQDSRQTFTWSIAPRAGYFISNWLNTGIDFQFYQYLFDDDMNYRILSLGIFMGSDFYRKKKFSTFIELSSGLGISKNVQHLVAPSGGKYVSKEYLKLPYYSGSIGAAFRLNQCFKLNLSAKFQKTIEKESNRSDSVSQHSINDNIEISPMLSVSYIFKGKAKTQE